MRSEEIFALRMRKAINKGFFSEMKEAEGENALIILKTAVEYIPTNKNQHKLDKKNWVM